ncbi:hypothetical protein DFS34DRAFT_687962 [Phlyctochytrium arcticum]|nr:hypothetical protein DFS34DRAFT_687962 [Phlyctochytrium arcticum]
MPARPMPVPTSGSIGFQPADPTPTVKRWDTTAVAAITPPPEHKLERRQNGTATLRFLSPSRTTYNFAARAGGINIPVVVDGERIPVGTYQLWHVDGNDWRPPGIPWVIDSLPATKIYSNSFVWAGYYQFVLTLPGAFTPNPENSVAGGEYAMETENGPGLPAGGFPGLLWTGNPFAKFSEQPPTLSSNSTSSSRTSSRTSAASTAWATPSVTPEAEAKAGDSSPNAFLIGGIAFLTVIFVISVIMFATRKRKPNTGLGPNGKILTPAPIPLPDFSFAGDYPPSIALQGLRPTPTVSASPTLLQSPTQSRPSSHLPSSLVVSAGSPVPETDSSMLEEDDDEGDIENPPPSYDHVFQAIQRQTTVNTAPPPTSSAESQQVSDNVPLTSSSPSNQSSSVATRPTLSTSIQPASPLVPDSDAKKNELWEDYSSFTNNPFGHTGSSSSMMPVMMPNTPNKPMALSPTNPFATTSNPFTDYYAATGVASSSAAPSPPSPSGLPQPGTILPIYYNHIAQGKYDMNLAAGHHIQVAEVIDVNWGSGAVVETGQRGLFPWVAVAVDIRGGFM